MFSQYTWGDFFKVMGSATVVYYAVIGWVFYRGDIRNFFTRRPTNGTTAQQADDDEDQEEGDELGQFFNVTSYQPSAPQSKPENAAPKEPEEKPQEAPQPSTAPAAKSRSAQQGKSTTEKPKKKGSSRKPKPDPKASTTSEKEVDLAGAPVIGDMITDDLFTPVAGAVVPQSEQFMENVVSAAQELEKAETGQVMATASASEGALQLADVINGQKIAFPSGFNFSRKQ